MNHLLFLLLTLQTLASVKTTFSDGSQPINVGEIDPSFNVTSQPNGKINAILPLSDGRVIVGGEFTKCGEIDQAYLAMFDSNGSLVESFTPTLNGRVNSIVSQVRNYPGQLFPESILVGGAFNQVNGVIQGGFAILKHDGSSFEFGLSPGFDGEVHAIVGPDINSEILIGGSFSSFNGSPAQNFVRMQPDPWSEFETWIAQIQDLQANGPVFTIEDTHQSGADRLGYYIGGQFTQIQETSVSNIAFVNEYGGLSEFTPSFLEFDGAVREIALIDSSLHSLIVRGDFSTYGNDPTLGIAFLYVDNSSYSLIPISAQDSPVTSLARSVGSQITLGHLDGSVSHFCGSYQSGSTLIWARTTHFPQSGLVLSSSITASRSDEFGDDRLGHNSYHASTSGELIRLFGLHGSTLPPPPNPEFILRNDQIQAILPAGLSLLEQECQISSNGGEDWIALNPSEAFLFKGLFPNHSYQIRARYRNSNGFGPYSEPINFTAPNPSRHSGARVPLDLHGELLPDSPYSIFRTYSGADDGILVHGTFSGTFSGEKKHSVSGLALYDSHLRLAGFKEDFQDQQSTPALSPPLASGGYYYRDTSLFSQLKIVKLNSDLTVNTEFPAIQISNSAAGISINSLNDDLIVNEVVSYDPPLLKFTKFDIDGERVTPSLEVEIDNPTIRNLVQLPSGDLLLNGWFRNLPSYPDQTFRRVIISTLGVITPLSFPSPIDNVRQVLLRPIAADGSQFVIDYSRSEEDPEFFEASLRKTNSHGENETNFSASFINRRYFWISITGIKLLRNGQILVSGYFTHCNGVLSPGLVRLNPDGSLDESFTPYLDRDQGSLGYYFDDLDLVEQSDGSITYPNRNFDSSVLVNRLRGNTTTDDHTLWASAHGFPSFIPNADPDNDGLSQEIELLYGLDPNKADSFLPLSFSLENGAVVPRVTPPTFPLSLPTFEHSTNLLDWNPSALRPDFTLDSSSNRSFYRLESDN